MIKPPVFPSMSVYIQSVTQHFSLPSSFGLSAVLGMPQSFSPPLSKYQTNGCESSRCSRFLHAKTATQRCSTLCGKTKTIASVRCTWLDWMNLRVFNTSNDALKVLQKKNMQVTDQFLFFSVK